jgi:hypothetical protein
VTTSKLPACLQAVLLLSLLAGPGASAHGGVVEEEDLCIIKVNYLRGHFKVFQPREDGHDEYCEDLPNATESVFVMEYLHDELGRVPIEFRIIRDVTGKGRFARWEDVQEIDDLDAVTVFAKGPIIEPDVFTAVVDFDEEGDYIGMVTAGDAEGGKIYRAVFPFEVGFTGFGYWPYIIGLLVLMQLQYLLMGGRYARWRNRRLQGAATCLAALLLAGSVEAEDAVGSTWVSAQGEFVLRIESTLQPIEINRMHRWLLDIRTADGLPVEDAEIEVSGGMPAHDHGLPTRPRITGRAADGRYVLGGVRFHMRGTWEIEVLIQAAGMADVVRIELRL